MEEQERLDFDFSVDQVKLLYSACQFQFNMLRALSKFMPNDKEAIALDQLYSYQILMDIFTFALDDEGIEI